MKNATKYEFFTNIRKFIAIGFSIFVFFSYFVALAGTPEELHKAIEEKAKELQAVGDQIKSTQKQLDAVQQQKNSLQKELKSIDYNVSQLKLGIKSSQINIEKLGMELEEAQQDINKIKDSISNKKLALIKLVRALYENDQTGSLIALLKHQSLAAGVLENQSIVNINNGLSVELTNLKSLNQQLEDKFELTAKKKQKVETESQNLKNRREIAEEQKSERQNLLNQTKNTEKAFASLIDSLEKRQAEISSEVEAIEKELRSKIDPSLLPIARPGVLAMPVNGILSQDYGETAFAKNGYRGKLHNGVDIAAPLGTEIAAAEKGRVVATGDQDQYCRRGAYGKFIVIEHENNLTTLYGHLSRIAVKKGDIVNRGQLIGYVGRTGYATGPHLHLTVYASQTFYMGASRSCGPMPLGGYLDPMDYL